MTMRSDGLSVVDFMSAPSALEAIAVSIVGGTLS